MLPSFVVNKYLCNILKLVSEAFPSTFVVDHELPSVLLSTVTVSPSLKFASSSLPPSTSSGT